MDIETGVGRLAAAIVLVQLRRERGVHPGWLEHAAGLPYGRWSQIEDGEHAQADELLRVANALGISLRGSNEEEENTEEAQAPKAG